VPAALQAGGRVTPGTKSAGTWLAQDDAAGVPRPGADVRSQPPWTAGVRAQGSCSVLLDLPDRATA